MATRLLNGDMGSERIRGNIGNAIPQVLGFGALVVEAELGVWLGEKERDD